MMNLDFEDEDAIRAYIDSELKQRTVTAMLPLIISRSFAALWDGLNNAKPADIAREIKQEWGVTISLDLIVGELHALRQKPTMRGILS